MARQTRTVPSRFASMPKAEVPRGRNGKHTEIVSQILSDLDRLDAGAALRVPLNELAYSKEKIRSALNRATRKDGRSVATASDDSFLYIWNETA